MSILRYFNKHHGWHDGKRTPFGGGNPISSVTNSISSALGTDGGGGGVLGGLAQLDKTVNNTIPGGWITVGGLAAGGLALAYAPEVMALAAETGVEPAVAAETLGIPPVDAATGSVVSPDVFAGLSANAPVDTSLSQAAASSMAGELGAGTNAALQGPTYGELGVTGLPEGAAGPTYGEMGYTGLNQQAAIDAANAASKGITASDVLSNANRAKSLANMLNQSATSGLTSSIGKLAQGANPVGSEMLNIVRGNQSPFSYQPQQPIQNTKPDLASLAQLLKQG
jgi:hypothetical protein